MLHEDVLTNAAPPGHGLVAGHAQLVLAVAIDNVAHNLHARKEKVADARELRVVVDDVGDQFVANVRGLRAVATGAVVNLRTRIPIVVTGLKQRRRLPKVDGWKQGGATEKKN